MTWKFSGYSGNWDEIKQRVKERDKNECQVCHVKVRPDGYLKSQCAHKISKSDQGDDNLDNLRTLCIPCHVIEHYEDPRSNNHMLNTNWVRKYLLDYLRQKPELAHKQGHYNKLMKILQEWNDKHGKETA